MSRKIHIGKNGPAICPAKKQCRLANPDGTPATHFDSWAAAGAEYEKRLSEEYGSTSTVNKNEDSISPSKESPSFSVRVVKYEKDLSEDSSSSSVRDATNTKGRSNEKPAPRKEPGRIGFSKALMESGTGSAEAQARKVLGGPVRLAEVTPDGTSFFELDPDAQDVKQKKEDKGKFQEPTFEKNRGLFR